MEIEKGSYLIAPAGEKAKPTLLRVVKPEKLICVVPDENAGTKEETIYRVKSREVMAWLGSELIQPATAFGVKLEPFYRQDTVKRWGVVRIYRNLDPSELEYFYSRLTYWAKVLNKRGWLYPTFETDIRPEKGTCCGTYHYKSAEETDKITFHPKALNQEADHTILHEIGHGTDFRLMSRRFRLQWVKLYHQHVILSRYNEKAVRALLKELGKLNSGMIKDFLDNLQQEEVKLAKSILDWVAEVHHLKHEDLEVFLSNGDTIADYLPEAREMFSGEVDPPVSKYAGRSSRELFAEAFSFYVRGEKLPKVVKELMSQTLERIGR